MVYIYILFSITEVLFSVEFFKKKINPISIFSLIWLFCIILYQSGLIQYNRTSMQTWFVLLMFSLAYFAGCLLSGIITKPYKRDRNQSDSIAIKKFKKKFLKQAIFILSFISSLSIIPKFLFIVKSYGLNLVAIGNIYQDSIYHRIEYDGILNTGNFVFLAVILAGIYAYEYKTGSMYVFAPLILAILSQISTGSRGSLVAVLFLFLCHFFLRFKTKNKSFKSLKKTFSLLLPLALLLGFFMILSLSRHNSDFTLPYASSFLEKLSSHSKLLYSFIFYFSSPIAVLNEFISSPRFSPIFGGATFRVFHEFFSSLGLSMNDSINFIDEYLYFTPAPSNVLSMFGELIYDFHYVGATCSVFILGYMFTYLFIKCKNGGSLFQQILLPIFFGLVGMSFFAWFLRLSIFWIAGILGLVLSVLYRILLNRYLMGMEPALRTNLYERKIFKGPSKNLE